MAGTKRPGGSSSGSRKKSKRNFKGKKTQDAFESAFADDNKMRAPKGAPTPSIPDVDLSDLDTGGPFALGGRPRMRGRVDKRGESRKSEPTRGGKRREDAKRESFDASRGWQSRKNSQKQSGRNIEGAHRQQPNRH